MPSPPQSCMARSMTRQMASEQCTLAIDDRAEPAFGSVSSSWAVRVMIASDVSRSMTDRAISSCARPRSDRRDPNSSRRCDPVQCDVQRPAGKAEPAHAVGQPSRAQPDLRVAETLPHRAEHRVVGQHAVVEVDVRVAAGDGRVQGVDAAADPETRVVGVDEEHGRPGGRVTVGVGPGHHDRERRPDSPTDETLLTVRCTQSPPRRHGGGGQRRRVGAGPGVRLGHREARPDGAGGEGRQVALLLGGGGDLVEQVHVALVRAPCSSAPTARSASSRPPGTPATSRAAAARRRPTRRGTCGANTPVRPRGRPAARPTPPGSSGRSRRRFGGDHRRAHEVRDGTSAVVPAAVMRCRRR